MHLILRRWPLACAAALLGALSACTLDDDGPLEVTGQIEGNPILAGSRVGGRVIEVLVDEGDRVAKGDVLIRLEANEAEAMVAAAEAQVDQAKAAYDKLKAGARPEEIRQAEARVAQAEQKYAMALEGARSQEIEGAQANLNTAKARLDSAMTEYQRAERLYSKGGVAERARDEALHAMEAAQGQYDAAREQRDLVVQGTRDEEIHIAQADLRYAEAILEELQNGARVEDIEAARAAYEMAKAELARAQVNLDEMTIVAPMDGVIESLDVHGGDLVGPRPIVEIIDPDDLEVTIYVGAALLGHLNLGQTISFTTDSHGAKTFEGTIIHINTIGEFTPRNLQTQEERVQQMFGVRLALDSYDGQLRPGMTITARVPAHSAES